jgi:hypothetical protein
VQVVSMSNPAVRHPRSVADRCHMGPVNRAIA